MGASLLREKVQQVPNVRLAQTSGYVPVHAAGQFLIFHGFSGILLNLLVVPLER